jgi:hypothetical protein
MPGADVGFMQHRKFFWREVKNTLRGIVIDVLQVVVNDFGRQNVAIQQRL